MSDHSGLLVYQNRTKSKRKLKSQLMKYNITQLIHLRASLEKESNQENVKAEKLKKYQQTIQLESENPEDAKVKRTKAKLIKTMWNMMQRNKYSYLTIIPYITTVLGSGVLAGNAGSIAGLTDLSKHIKDTFYNNLGDDNKYDLAKIYEEYNKSSYHTKNGKKIYRLVYEEAIQNAIHHQDIDVTSKENVKQIFTENNIKDDALVDKIVEKQTIQYNAFDDFFNEKNNKEIAAGATAVAGIGGLGTHKLNQYAKDLREKRIEQFMKAEQKLKK